MPTYTYFCEKCNHKFESFRKIDNRKEPESEPCPSCNEVGFVRQGVSEIAVVLSIGVSSMTTKSLRGSAFEEKLNLIHQRTPGSNLDKASTIVNVK